MLRRLDGHLRGCNSVKQAALPPCAFTEPSMPELISDDLEGAVPRESRKGHLDAGERRFRAEPRGIRPFSRRCLVLYTPDFRPNAVSRQYPARTTSAEPNRVGYDVRPSPSALSEWRNEPTPRQRRNIMARNNQKPTSQQHQAPDFLAWHVNDKGEKSFWNKVGAAGRTRTARASRSNSKSCPSTGASSCANRSTKRRGNNMTKAIPPLVTITQGILGTTVWAARSRRPNRSRPRSNPKIIADTWQATSMKLPRNQNRNALNPSEPCGNRCSKICAKTSRGIVNALKNCAVSGVRANRTTGRSRATSTPRSASRLRT